MPISNKSVWKGIKNILLPLFITYGAIIVLILKSIIPPEFADISIYITILLSGLLMLFYIEKSVMLDLMEIEKAEYFKNLNKIFDDIKKTHKFQDEEYILSEKIKGGRGADYLRTQFEYYLAKSLEAYKMSSSFLFSLTGGILLDISLSSLKSPDIHRTIILIGIIAAISSIFMYMSILKYVEYHAACAIYRNGILGREICISSFASNKFGRTELVDRIAQTLSYLRGTNCPADKKDGECDIKYTIDGYATTQLLIWFGIIQKPDEKINLSQTIIPLNHPQAAIPSNH